MNYQDALEKLYSKANLGIQLGLTRVETAAEELGAVHRQFNCIQIAGTNGKGTVSTLVAGALERLGLKVGLFTSPHLHRFSERIKINGKEAPPDLIAGALERVFALTNLDPSFQPTFFETVTLAALIVFAEAKVDLAVLEVGLGGRLDSTSVCAPKVAAITSIGLDHTKILGATLEQIAGEKAAIARPGIPLITGPLNEPARRVVAQVALENQAVLRMCGRDFEVPGFVKPPWPGRHSRENAAVAFEIIKQFHPASPVRLQAVFEQTLARTTWPGRFEFVDFEGRQILLDGAHNTEAILSLIDGMDEGGVRPCLVIFGSAEDKPVAPMLEHLRRRVARFILAPPPVPRAFEPRRYAQKGDNVADSTSQAIELLSQLTQKGETVLVTGSLFTVGEARRIILGLETDPPIRM